MEKMLSEMMTEKKINKNEEGQVRKGKRLRQRAMRDSSIKWNRALSESVILAGKDQVIYYVT